MSSSTTRTISVTKTIIGYLTKKDGDQFKNPTRQLQKIKFGKNCKNEHSWAFDENIDEPRFNSLRTQFENLCASCDDVAKPLSSNNSNASQIVKTKKCQRVYTHNEHKYISIEGEHIPIQYKLGKVDILVDFSCKHKHRDDAIDIRFVSQQINTTSAEVNCVKEFDSVWEQRFTTYTFFDCVCVHFIIEFDVTNSGIVNSSINRIEITIKKDAKNTKTQIDLEDFELLLTRIFELMTMSTHKSSKSSKSSKSLKSCNRKKCKKCVFEIICNYQKL